MNKIIISSSEIGSYNYCARAWYYRRINASIPQEVKEKTDQNFNWGVKMHDDYALMLKRMETKEKISNILIALLFGIVIVYTVGYHNFLVAFPILVSVILYLKISLHLEKKKVGIPGKIIYSDAELKKVEKPFFSSQYSLTGRPDYLVEDKGKILPVEFKPKSFPTSPYTSHIMQLLSYCLLIEEMKGRKPPYGIIRYLDREFKIPYGEKEKKNLLDQITKMQYAIYKNELPSRNHNFSSRCSTCNYVTICEESLA